MGAIDEILAATRQYAQVSRQIQIGLADVNARIRETASILHTSLGHTRHPMVLQAVYEVESATQRTNEAIQYLTRLQNVLRIFAAGIQSGSDTEPRSNHPIAAGPSTHSGLISTPVELGDDDAFDPQPYLDNMPVFSHDPHRKPKTHGRWVDGNGEVHNLLSGHHDGDYLLVNERAVDLGLIPAKAQLARAGDVELKFALRMQRTEGIQINEFQRRGVLPT